MINGTLLEFTTSDGIRLNAFLAGKRRKVVCIIYVHGMGGNFYSGTAQKRLMRDASKNGMAFLAINTRGHDTVAYLSRPEKRKKWLTGGTDLEVFEKCALDIEAAVALARRLGFRSIILAGHSTGCQKITYFQYRRKRSDIKGLILLAPADDYNIHRKKYGRRISSIVRQCRKKAEKGEGMRIGGESTAFLSALRFLSLADLGNVEARLFNYDGPLKEFSSIETPICALFGSKEEYALKPVGQYLSILAEKTRSRLFMSKVIKGAAHSFENHEAEMSAFVMESIARMLAEK